MRWKIELSQGAVRELDKLDPQVARRILRFLNQRIAPLDDPRSIGEALAGVKLGEFWKYRQGDYRIVAKIQDEVVTVLVIRVGHRREIYRG